jgi:hypothetical protein
MEEKKSVQCTEVSMEGKKFIQCTEACIEKLHIDLEPESIKTLFSSAFEAVRKIQTFI